MVSWKKSDLNLIPKNGLKVFSCFHCGGGSSFGYKLAGYEVLGGVEIDKTIMPVYRKNLHPKYSYLMSVKDFNELPNSELPRELFELDILDGSPPCSSFSTAGAREKNWGKDKFFREGQSSQVLDGLFFDFIQTAEKLKPKIVVAENVKGLITGKAKFYVKLIFQNFKKIGYDCQLFLLNAAYMNVPQTRERVFFIARRQDLMLPQLSLNPNEKLISVKDAWIDLPFQKAKEFAKDSATYKFWFMCQPGENFSRYHPKGSRFNERKNFFERPSCTLIATGKAYHPIFPRRLTNAEIYRLQTFPDDYDCEPLSADYLCGMSVPPRMSEYIAKIIQKEWLDQ